MIFDENGKLSREFLISQKTCCHNGCVNCPYEERAKEMNGLTYKKPLKSELEKKIYDFYNLYPNLHEKINRHVCLSDMTGMEKKALLDEICEIYKIKKYTISDF